MRIYINGIGVTGGFGRGLTDLLSCLENRVTHVKTPALISARNSNGTPAYLADTAELETFVPKRSLRRIDHFSQMALLGAYLALQDAGITSLSGKRTGLVVCSGYGASNTTFSFLDSIIDDGDVCASPTLFSNSVHNAAAGHISILLELDGPCLTVSQFEMSVPSALLSASRWLEEGRVDQVLFGAVDEYCSVLGYCWKRFFGENNNNIMSPLAPGRQSAIPGEGSAFFLLSKERSGSSRYGTIVHVGMGRHYDSGISSIDETIFFLGADGHKSCDRLYGDFMPPGAEAACYSPLYGSIPMGDAFDMAIAALSIRECKIFASPESVADQEKYKIIKETSPITSKAITCLKLTKNNEFGMITLAFVPTCLDPSPIVCDHSFRF
jgi:3-oxoacyl-[acyl-carrier-protein] synthase II